MKVEIHLSLFLIIFLLDDFRLFVGNLGHDVTDQLLKTSFARFTSLTNVRVVKDSRTFKSKGYGFVAFSDPDDYLNAMKEMNGRPSFLSLTTFTINF